MIAEDLLFYSIFDVEPNYAREQWKRIGYQLRQEPAATIQAFVAFTRRMADGISEQRFQQSKDLLLSMPHDLGLLADPR